MSSETAAHPRVTGAANGLAASFVFVVMLLTALALWTAIPVGWLWIGSKVATTQFPAVGPYAVVGIGIILTIVLDAWLIGRLNALYIRITGTNRLAPMRPSWLKSMSESESDVGPRGTTVVEAVMMGSVLLAGFVFVGWFFLLAGSPIPNQ
jgi:hypothetical protein